MKRRLRGPSSAFVSPTMPEPRGENPIFPGVLAYLADVFSGAPPEGAIMGRTALRDAVAARLGCSQLQAEELVDSLVLRGNLRLISTPESGELWSIEVPGDVGRPVR